MIAQLSSLLPSNFLPTWESTKKNVGYYADNWYAELPKIALISAPIGSAIVMPLLTGFFLWPQSVRSILEEEDDSFTLRDLSQIPDFVNWYKAKNFSHSYLNNKSWSEEDVTAAYQLLDKTAQMLSQETTHLYQTIEKFNHLHNTHAELVIELTEEGQPYCPFGTTGDQTCSESLQIVREMPCVNIQRLIDLIQQLKAERDDFEIRTLASPEMNEFVIAHEFSHIKHRDSLQDFVYLLATSAISLIPWIVNERTADSYGVDYAITSYIQSFCIASVACLLASAQHRALELRADQEAIESLGTTKGAIAFFETLDEHLANFEHPPKSIRLENLKKLSL